MDALTTTHTLPEISRFADTYAAGDVFNEYRSTKADNTLAAQGHDFTAFVEFLHTTGAQGVPGVDSFMTTPSAWSGISWGIVEAFKRYMLQNGNSIATVNRRLATIKRYARLANQAGVLSMEEATLIGGVRGYSGNAAKRIDERRAVTRVGLKKARNVSLTYEQADALIAAPDTATPQGRRDQLMLCLFIHHGFRVGEVANLQIEWFNVKDRQIYVERGKTGISQLHELTNTTLAALHAYINAGDCPETGIIWRRSSPNGKLTDAGMTPRSIRKRVKHIGEGVGIENLSPHDLRHYWATYWADRAARGAISLLQLQEAGGWSAGSLNMLRRYVDGRKIANQGMNL